MSSAQTAFAMLRGGVTACALSLAPVASLVAAAYSYDPAAVHERGPATVYFGSARDVDGKYLSGVTIIIKTRTVDFVIATDATGRFRSELPMQVAPSEVTVGCSKTGMSVVRVSKRAPRGAEITPVQVDCLLK